MCDSRDYKAAKTLLTFTETNEVQTPRSSCCFYTASQAISNGMASDLQTVAQLLNATLDHRQHKQGESCVIEVLVELLSDQHSGDRSQG